MNKSYDVYMCRNPLDKLVGWHKSEINTVEFHALCDEAQESSPDGELAILIDDSTELIVKAYFK